MADKPRGKLADISWSQPANTVSVNVKPKSAHTNSVSVNVNKSQPAGSRSNQSDRSKHSSNRSNYSRQSSNQSSHARQTSRHSDSDEDFDYESAYHRPELKHAQQIQTRPTEKKTTSNISDFSLSDIPINPYPSVVAPVKSGKDVKKPRPDINRNYQSRPVVGADNSNDEPEHGKFLVGFLGSMAISTNDASSLSGITAIQKPMSVLYFPYRQDKQPAEQRVLNLEDVGLEVRYLQSPDDEEFSSFVIEWKNVIYVEPLKFSTMRQKGKVLSAFEPAETHRNSMILNRAKLFNAMSKEHKHISLLDHPALFCIVVRDPHGRHDQMFVHGYICSTVEESVYIARCVQKHMHLNQTQDGTTPEQSNDRRSSQGGYNNDGYAQSSNMSINSYMSSESSKSKLMGKKKKNKRDSGFTQYSGSQKDSVIDEGSFHFGMSMAALVRDEGDDDSISEAMRNNFHIGPMHLQSNDRNPSDSKDRFSAAMDEEFEVSSKPVGVVHPQRAQGFKVLPNEPVNRARLRHTNQTKSPEAALANRGFDDTPFSQPRNVLNPLADIAAPGEPVRGHIATAKMGQAAALSSLPFQSGGSMPPSAWHESVIGNYQKKEQIENRINSERVDPKELPKLQTEKKEREIANLFNSTADPSTANNTQFSNVQDMLGFMP